jgi:hypothetical protein
MKRITEILCGMILLVSCNSQKIYSDFDISYSRSGGFAPVYENLLIKGNNAHYSFEGQGKKYKQDFKVSQEDLNKIEHTLSQNNFRKIQEDHQKIYDHISTSVNVKKGPNAGNKTDASSIMPNFRTNWTNITNVFQQLINTNIKKQ